MVAIQCRILDCDDDEIEEMIQGKTMNGPKPKTKYSTHWLESPAWDVFWMLSGLWLLALVVFAQWAGYTPMVPNILAFGALLLLWGGHILAPVIVSWKNSGLRSEMMVRKGKYVVLPGSILCGATALGILGDINNWSVIPAEIKAHINPRFLLFYVFFLWNTWHFSAQHFGVLAIYRTLAGQFSQRYRQGDRVFCVVMTCILLPVAWYTQERYDRLGPLMQYFPEPSTLESMAGSIIALSAIITLVFMGLEALKPKRSIPRTWYILSIGIQPIFGVMSYPLYHMVVFSFCHWMIEFALASRILRNQARAPDGVSAQSNQDQNTSSFLSYIVVFALISIPMYLLFFYAATHRYIASIAAAQFDYRVYFGYGLGDTPILLGAISGLYFGISFVHFLYDRYLFAFSKSEIRCWVAPHLFRSIR